MLCNGKKIVVAQLHHTHLITWSWRNNEEDQLQQDIELFNVKTKKHFPPELKNNFFEIIIKETEILGLKSKLQMLTFKKINLKCPRKKTN